uniref:ZAD domain-containing protein n=1 Tax=Tabanus bromius TaxID=304241 RepID=A0A0K8TN54_TABBR
MGSIDKACISGFLCRLCSEMHRTVIHIYGDQGQKHRLVEKINGYLPVTIKPTDPLPKTICEACLKRVEEHYELLVRITQYRQNKCFEKRELRPRPCKSSSNESVGGCSSQSSQRMTRNSRRNCTATTSSSTTNSRESKLVATNNNDQSDDDL